MRLEKKPGESRSSWWARVKLFMSYHGIRMRANWGPWLDYIEIPEN